MFLDKLARACAAGAALVAAPCTAQTEDTDPFHWAYAASLGAGVYRLGDGTEAQAYRGNFSVRLREAESGRAGVRRLLPVAMGLQNLDDDDLPVDRPSDEIEHAGFLPGIELEHLVGQRWTLRSRRSAAPRSSRARSNRRGSQLSEAQRGRVRSRFGTRRNDAAFVRRKRRRSAR